jgi:DNA repair exonuclease SbcCD ATPase subunit
MLNIHAISYNNIWPFAGKKLSVFFASGKYLIKAPIGSGKSFLFFDGPLYGLYKHSERRMLNIHHKTGYIKIIFSIHDQYYLIVRDLTQGKSKESCTSQQFLIHDNEKLIPLLQTNNIVQQDVDIEQLLKQNTIRLEEIVYKNETDLQQTLWTILPPREVFTSTMFLLQESQNIFELTPGDRIEILKNVFDLMSIDTAKERIAEKKREVQLQKKILWDTQHQDAKLRISLQSLINAYDELSQQEQRATLQQYASIIKERSMIVDKITLDQCSIPQELSTIVQTTQSQMQQYQQQQQSYLQTIAHLEQNIHKIQEKIQQTTTHIQTTQGQIETIKTHIESANIPDPTQLKEQIIQHTEKQAAIQSSIVVNQYRSINVTVGLDIAEQTHAIIYAHQVIQAAIQHGKLLAEELKNHETARQYLEERYTQYRTQRAQYELTQWTESYTQMQLQIAQQSKQIEQEQQILVTKKQSIEQQASDIQAQIDGINTRIHSITKDNPDIKACVDEIKQALTIHDIDRIQQIQTIISKYLGDKQVAQLTQELNNLVSKRESLQLQENIDTINTSIQALEQKQALLESNPSSVLGDFLQTIEEKKQQIDTAIASLDYDIVCQKHDTAMAQVNEKIIIIKEFLHIVDWKKTESNHEQRELLQKEKESFQSQLDAIDALIQTQQEQQKQLDTLQIQINQRTQDLEQLQSEYTQEQTKLSEYKQSTVIVPTDILQQREQQTKTIEKSLHTISDLVRDHTSNQQKLNTLAQEEKILTNLYHIVSKELLLLVLGESLTILTEIINVYLAQIFSLQLHLEIEKTSSDKVELAAYCEDEHGKREVKSLSWWQKTILKLVWMLAIASYLRSPMLFLDETINNIDKDTVGKVADMLTDFVKKHDIKLYTITHSEQIQGMNIWDGIVEVAKI